MTNAIGLMLTPGDVITLDLGTPTGSDAGMRRPAVVVTAKEVLRGGPNVIQVVPLTRTIRNAVSEIVVETDAFNELAADSAAQCQHIRAVATTRIAERLGNIGPVKLGQIRATIATLLDI